MINKKFPLKSIVIPSDSTLKGNRIISAPEIFTVKRTSDNSTQGEIIFRPYFVQKGRGPHIYDLVWATDQNWDTFYSNISK